jgi:hypothetical protein
MSNPYTRHIESREISKLGWALIIWVYNFYKGKLRIISYEMVERDRRRTELDETRLLLKVEMKEGEGKTTKLIQVVTSIDGFDGRYWEFLPIWENN